MSGEIEERDVDREEAWEWPRCPACAQPRQTRCPGCHIPGSHFLVAEYAPAVAPARKTRRSDRLEDAADSSAEGDVVTENRLPPQTEELAPKPPSTPSENPWGDDFDDESEPTMPIIDGRVWLVCSLCEEAFQPRFYRTCEKCGHDFGHGIEVDDLTMDWPERAVMVAIALISVMAGLLGYFWMLLR